jgi:hypothetical protein
LVTKSFIIFFIQESFDLKFHVLNMLNLLLLFADFVIFHKLFHGSQSISTHRVYSAAVRESQVTLESTSERIAID